MKEYKKKLSAMIICFNEELWIEHCIRGIYDWVDEIIVVEGMVKLIKRSGGQFGDKTTQKVRAIKDPDKKIRFFPGEVFENKLEQRQFALDRCTGDWVLIVDADEFYTVQDLKTMREVIDEKGDEARMILYPHYNFYDFGNYFKKNYMERLFRNDGKDVGYWGRPADGQNIYHRSLGKLWDHIDFLHSQKNKDFLFLTSLICFHYSKIKTKDYLYLRSRYYVWRSDLALSKERLEQATQDYMQRIIVAPDMKQMGKFDPGKHPVIVKRHWLYLRYMELMRLGEQHKFMEYLLADKFK